MIRKLRVTIVYAFLLFIMAFAKRKIATNCIDKANSQAVWLRKIFKDQWEKRLAAS